MVWKMKLDINDVASSLNLPANILKRWIRQGSIPIHRSNETCIFKREKLEEWARRNNLIFKPESDNKNKNKESFDKILSMSVSDGEVLYGVPPGIKSELFSYVIDTLNLKSDIRKKLFERLIEREDMSSTGVGRGVGIPHPRDPLSKIGGSPRIITAFLKEPMDYESIDNEKVFVLFFILCKDVKEHLKILSNLSFCLRHDSFIAFLRKKPSKEELLVEIGNFEERLKNH